MKTLYVVRHAKSSWANLGEADFDRDLNERGKADAPEMAARLKKKNIHIDAYICSPAKRAKQTCKAFCKVLNAEKEKIIFIDSLYHASAATFFEVAHSIDDAHNSVALFSHNPGITEFVNKLCDGVRIDNMPTCSVFAVSINAMSWKDFEKAEKKLQFFDFPKASLT